VPIQLAQCWFPGLAISNAKYKYIFQIKYTEALLSNSTRKLLRFEITKVLLQFKKLFYCVIYYNLRHIFAPHSRRVDTVFSCLCDSVCPSVCPLSRRKTARATNTKLCTMYGRTFACTDPEIKRSRSTPRLGSGLRLGYGTQPKVEYSFLYYSILNASINNDDKIPRTPWYYTHAHAQSLSPSPNFIFFTAMLAPPRKDGSYQFRRTHSPSRLAWSGVGGHPALSLYSSNEPGELSR